MNLGAHTTFRRDILAAMRMTTLRCARWAVLSAPALLLGACSKNAPSPDAADAPYVSAFSAPSARVSIVPGAYSAAFDQAKHALRELGFFLERVDAAAGVITTRPLGSGGIATPWSDVQTGFDQMLEDAAQRQQRVVRIDFVPAVPLPAGAEPPDDLRTYNQPIQARIVVTMLRVYGSTLKINIDAIGWSTYPIDAELQARNMLGYSVAIKADRRLADRIAADLSRQVNSANPHAATGEGPVAVPQAAPVQQPTPAQQPAAPTVQPSPATAPQTPPPVDPGWQPGSRIKPEPAPPR